VALFHIFALVSHCDQWHHLGDNNKTTRLLTVERQRLMKGPIMPLCHPWLVFTSQQMFDITSSQ